MMDHFKTINILGGCLEGIIAPFSYASLRLLTDIINVKGPVLVTGSL